MQIFFLQFTKATDNVLNYGAIGAILILCLLAIAYMAKFFMKLYNKLSDKCDAMQLQLNKYVNEDRDKLISVITKNTKAFESFERVVEKRKKLEDEEDSKS